jgi:antitoxin MazE
LSVSAIQTRSEADAAETTIKGWGSSLALRIPKPLAKEIGLGEGSAVELSVEDGKLVVRPLATPRYEPEALLAGITADNLDDEVESGPATGREAW